MYRAIILSFFTSAALGASELPPRALQGPFAKSLQRNAKDLLELIEVEEAFFQDNTLEQSAKISCETIDSLQNSNHLPCKAAV
jgi:hypothetical protein